MSADITIVYQARNYDSSFAVFAILLANPTKSKQFCPVQKNELKYRFVAGAQTFFVDCLPEALLKEALEYGSQVTIIDDHDTSEPIIRHFKEQYPDITVIFDKQNSPCILAWRYYNLPENNSLFDLIRYVEDSDKYKWSLPHSREVSSGIRELVKNCDFIDNSKAAADLAALNLEYVMQIGYPLVVQRWADIKSELHDMVFWVFVYGE